MKLGYRPPYDFRLMLEFFEGRMLEGVELVDSASYTRTARVSLPDGDLCEGWIRVEQDEKEDALKVTMSETLLPAVSQVMTRVRRQFDTDCDPHTIHEGIASMNDVVPGSAVLGTRLPGCFDPFETAVRAVLGQQVSVKAANRFAARIIQEYGMLLESGIEGLTHTFPDPSVFLALDPIEEALGPLGVIATRSRCIGRIAELIQAGELDLSPTAIISDQIRVLLSVKGIGPWTANYIAMRTMGYSDAFLETDVGVANALPDHDPKQRLELAEKWRPWRSYANISLWNSLSRKEES